MLFARVALSGRAEESEDEEESLLADLEGGSAERVNRLGEGMAWRVTQVGEQAVRRRKVGVDLKSVFVARRGTRTAGWVRSTGDCSYTVGPLEDSPF